MLGLLTLAACVITVNWATYIWSVNNGHVVESSLGYFINPLVTVLMGVFIFVGFIAYAIVSAVFQVSASFKMG